jgi:hypothetical protein
MSRGIVLLLMAVFIGAARGEERLTLSGAAERPLPDSDAPVVVEFPLTLSAAVKTVPRLKVVSATLDGKQWQADGFRASVEILQAGAALLRVKVDPRQAREPGKYALTLLASSNDANAAAQLLTVTLTRAAGELRMTSPLRIRRIVTIPWLSASVKPETATISEASRLVAVTPFDIRWRVDLSDGNDPAGVLNITLPARLEAGKQYAVSLSAASVHGLGTANGTLTVRAPQLTSGTFEQAVEVKSRLSFFWLFLTLLIGIAGGVLVRTRAEKKRLRAGALLEASAQRKAIEDRIPRTPDAEDAEALKSELLALARVMADRSSTPEQIRAKAGEATTTANRIVTDANARHQQAVARLAQMKSAAGPSDQYAGEVAALVAGLHQRLSEIAKHIDAGQARTALARLDEVETSFKPKLRDALTRWSGEVTDALAEIGTWPDLPSGIDGARTALQALDPAADPAASLAAAANLARALRYDVFGRTLRNIARVAETVAEEITKMKDRTKTADDAIAELRARAGTVAAWQGDVAGEPLRDIASAVRSLRRAMKDMLADAHAQLKVAVPQAEGEFLAALAELKKSAREVRLGAQPAPQPGVTIPYDTAAAPPPVSPAAEFRIVISGDAVVGQLLRFRVVPPDVRSVDWSVNGAKQSSGPESTFAYVARSAEAVAVTASIEREDRSRTSAEIRIEVIEAPAIESDAALAVQQRGAERVQTAVAALLIVLAGMLIFKGSFVGTFEDFVAALLWGFGTDVGLARVREISQPLLGRAVVFPGAG